MKDILKNKKILIICNSTFAFNKFLTSLNEKLTINKSVIYLIVGKDKYNKNIQFLNKKNIFIVEMPNRKFFNFISLAKSIHNIRKIIIKHNFDLVISNNRDASFCSRMSFFFLKKNHTKNIYFARGFYFHDNQNIILWVLTYFLEVFLLLRTDLVLSQTKEDLRKIKFFSNLFKIPVKWIGNGIIKNKYSFRYKKINYNKIIFSTICRITKGKGIEDLIKVFYVLSSTYDNLFLKIIGGPLSEHDHKFFEKIKKSSDFQKIKHKIEITGITELVNSHLDMSDIYLHPSYREGMPKSLLEAMSKGIIPIASKIRGSREIINHSKNGFLFEPKNINQFKENIIKVININEEDLKKISFNAHKSIELYDDKLYLERQLEGIISCIN
jgi:glycosyltransferase involved in cell wall biosynthesis